ncbi:NucA/NucB deoxyribonuclease domain-containing protein [Actinokineospora auranticolor]|uniref:NucA/NucB deoxyribonuclease domain-containing protein n=1 Tax=Actinokineospora auranticolor TaxID=155976 RepID=UPI0011B09373|nr:NucA/NucB deoxyribonuclease domain-containing protein [Actinokineospora auranticolor]
MAYVGPAAVIDTVTGVFESRDPVLIEDEGHQLLVGGDGETKARQCTVLVALTTRRCGDAKVVVIDAAKMPFIARNIHLAWGEGQPSILTRNSAKQAANRAAACGKFVPKNGGSCDEYSFATTDEGGSGARTEEVPLREQRCQGGAISAGYAKAKVGQGDSFLVVIASPAQVATAGFAGADVADVQVEQCAL